MVYYRIQHDGPVRTQGPDWDMTCTRVAGWKVRIDASHTGREYIIIERETGKYYLRREGIRSYVYEITRNEARAAWKHRRLSRLVPVLD